MQSRADGEQYRSVIKQDRTDILTMKSHYACINCHSNANIRCANGTKSYIKKQPCAIEGLAWAGFKKPAQAIEGHFLLRVAS